MEINAFHMWMPVRVLGMPDCLSKSCGMSSQGEGRMQKIRVKSVCVEVSFFVVSVLQNKVSSKFSSLVAHRDILIQQRGKEHSTFSGPC